MAESLHYNARVDVLGKEQTRAGVAKVVEALASYLSARENLVEPSPYMPIAQGAAGWRSKYQPRILPLHGLQSFLYLPFSVRFEHCDHGVCQGEGERQDPRAAEGEQGSANPADATPSAITSGAHTGPTQSG